LVVDYCQTYQKLESHCKIAGCNVHIERYLRRLINDFKIAEAKQMYKLLSDLRNRCREVDMKSLETKYASICDSYLNKYNTFNEFDKSYYKEAYLLFRRLKLKMNQHLAFVNNANVPYSNNLIERDFRHAKTKMKISGSFRS
jgi:hypothetical protein